VTFWSAQALNTGCNEARNEAKPREGKSLFKQPSEAKLTIQNCPAIQNLKYYFYILIFSIKLVWKYTDEIIITEYFNRIKTLE
jgi:hypothetical protein